MLCVCVCDHVYVSFALCFSKLQFVCVFCLSFFPEKKKEWSWVGRWEDLEGNGRRESQSEYIV